MKKQNHPVPGFVIIGCPESRRVQEFQNALRLRGQPAARVVFYIDLLAGRVNLADVVGAGDWARLESPGRHWPTENAILALAASQSEVGRQWLSLPEVQALVFDKGRLWPSRQWYCGWLQILELVGRQLQECPPHQLMNALDDIALMFDKSRCHQSMSRQNLPVPRALPSPGCWDELVAQMETHNCRRVFVKIAHGSSASGVVAYQTDGTRHRAFTTVEVVERAGQVMLYNSRRVKVISKVAEIATLIDNLCLHSVHVEEWVPKAGWQSRVFDFRVMVIGGRAQHVVMRTSETPMTNLHLLNQRGDVEKIRVRLDEEKWLAMLLTCEKAMQCFPGSLYAGLDVMWTPDYRRHYILEANAFGDLLPGVLYNGLDTYTAEIEAALSLTK